MIYRTPEKIDEANAEKIGNELKELAKKREDIIIDMSQTIDIRFAGLRPIIFALKYIKNNLCDFSIVNINSTVKEIFEVTGVDGLILLTDEERKEILKNSKK